MMDTDIEPRPPESLSHPLRSRGSRAFANTDSRKPERLESTGSPNSTVAPLLIGMAALWCAAMCARVPPVLATTALAAAYGLLFLLLLPFHRWNCFLVLVAGCGAEIALRAWSPMRYNTLHYATLVLLPVAYVLVRPRAHLPRPLIFWFGLCLWFVVSLLWSKEFSVWLVWTTEYWGIACLALLTRQLATSPRRRREMGMVYATTSLAVLVALLVVYGVRGGARLGLMAGMNANGVGQVAALGILMLAISCIEAGRQRLLHPVNLSLLMMLGIGLMLSQSRGSMLCVAGAALTFAWGQPRLHHRLLALSACALLFTGLVFGAMRLDPAGMQQRFQSTFHKGDLAGRTAGRSEIARTAALMFRDNWIAGVGAGQFEIAYERYSVQAQSTYNNDSKAAAHSAYLKIPVEGGLVAVLLLFGFYTSLWLGAARLPAGRCRAMACGTVLFLLIGAFSSEGIEKGNWLAVGLLLIWFWEAGVAKGMRNKPASRVPGRGMRPGKNRPADPPSLPRRAG